MFPEITGATPSSGYNCVEWRVVFHPEMFDQLRIRVIYDPQSRKTRSIKLDYRCPGDRVFGWWRSIADDFCTREAIDAWIRRLLAAWADTEDLEIKRAEAALIDRKNTYQQARNILGRSDS